MGNAQSGLSDRHLHGQYGVANADGGIIVDALSAAHHTLHTERFLSHPGE